MKNYLYFITTLLLTSVNGIAQELPIQNPFQEPGTATRGIFGEDDRKEATDAKEFKDYVRATAVMIPKAYFRNYRIYGITLRQRLTSVFGSSNFDPNVKFLDQPAVAQCTGFLIAPDILVTAGHCIQDMDTADDYYWVFDYTNNLKYNPTENYFEVNQNSIYEVKEVLAAEYLDDNYLESKDYSVLRLHTKTDRRPYRFRTSGTVTEGTQVFTVGTPTGLPLKLAENSKVITTEPQTWFMSDTDVFPGNSGGPVFDPSGWIEGILVRTAAQTLADGELTADYKFDETCNCIKTVEFNEVDGTAGSQAHKINTIPDWILRKSIFENLRYAIENNQADRFKDWEVYNWIFSDSVTVSRLRLEDVAVAFKRYDMLDQILDHTAKVYSDKTSREILDYVYWRKDLDALDVILKHEVYVDAGIDMPHTFLQELVIAGEVSWVEKILEYQPNVQVLDSSGNNLLHLAAAKGNLEMLELLGSYGVYAGQKNLDKQLPEKIAKAAKQKSAAKFLKKLRKGKIKLKT